MFGLLWRKSPPAVTVARCARPAVVRRMETPRPCRPARPRRTDAETFLRKVVDLGEPPRPGARSGEVSRVVHRTCTVAGVAQVAENLARQRERLERPLIHGCDVNLDAQPQRQPRWITDDAPVVRVLVQNGRSGSGACTSVTWAPHTKPPACGISPVVGMSTLPLTARRSA